MSLIRFDCCRNESRHVEAYILFEWENRIARHWLKGPIQTYLINPFTDWKSLHVVKGFVGDKKNNLRPFRLNCTQVTEVRHKFVEYWTNCWHFDMHQGHYICNTEIHTITNIQYTWHSVDFNMNFYWKAFAAIRACRKNITAKPCVFLWQKGKQVTFIRVWDERSWFYLFDAPGFQQTSWSGDGQKSHLLTLRKC